VPEELDEIIAVAPSYAVFSPNLLEMQSILSITPADSPKPSDVVQAAERFHQLITSTGRVTPAVIVRAGEMGSYTMSERWTGWVPAYWREGEQDRVVDVTGGGNGFLGGLCAGLLLSENDFRTGQYLPVCDLGDADMGEPASILASTAASFSIQQRGPPRLTHTSGGERWNGDDPWTRLREMARRVNDLEP